jgi:hypothetical protein
VNEACLCLIRGLFIDEQSVVDTQKKFGFGGQNVEKWFGVFFLPA